MLTSDNINSEFCASNYAQPRYVQLHEGHNCHPNLHVARSISFKFLRLSYFVFNDMIGKPVMDENGSASQQRKNIFTWCSPCLITLTFCYIHWISVTLNKLSLTLNHLFGLLSVTYMTLNYIQFLSLTYVQLHVFTVVCYFQLHSVAFNLFKSHEFIFNYL